MDAVGAELVEGLRFVPDDLVRDGLHGLVNFVSAVVGAGANGAGEHLLLAIDHGRNAHHIVGARLQARDHCRSVFFAAQVVDFHLAEIVVGLFQVLADAEDVN